MNKSAVKFLVCCQCILLAPADSRAETETAEAICFKSSAFLAPIDSADYRKYAPDREVEILRLALDARLHQSYARRHSHLDG
jgi:hypothetical protein